MSRDSAHGVLFVKGFTGFEHPIREVHQFPHGSANHHHFGLPACTQALPEGTEQDSSHRRRSAYRSTSVAWKRSVVGIVRPMASAVFRLMTDYGNDSYTIHTQPTLPKE
jgi:hypothetical protein